MARQRRTKLAGMALANGVLVIGPTRWAAAVRDRNGEVVVADGRRPVAPAAVDRVPIVRGGVRLGEMLAVLPLLRTALPQARLMVEAAPTLGALAGGAVAGNLLRSRTKSIVAGDLMSAAATLAATLVATRTSELGRYHGAEHKVIGAWEAGIDPVDAPREHERCGTHVALPMFVTTTVCTAVARKLLPRHPAGAMLLGSIVGAGIAMELVRRAQRTPDAPASRALAKAGHFVQAFAATREPRRDQLDVAQAALDRLLARER
jgi:uncharacterized protein YqhQ